MNWKRTEEKEQKITRNKMLYKGYENTNEFTKFKTVRTFGNVLGMA